MIGTDQRPRGSDRRPGLKSHRSSMRGPVMWMCPREKGYRLHPTREKYCPENGSGLPS